MFAWEQLWEVESIINDGVACLLVCFFNEEEEKEEAGVDMVECERTRVQCTIHEPECPTFLAKTISLPIWRLFIMYEVRININVENIHGATTSFRNAVAS
jgi:hypothetical protein